ncbi:hypothetical protein GW758_00300 [Candidatus Falkowbacteria bacterium]|nr:hypothetical protein [Candidatus Falkowbacteria bacterium]
MDKKSMREIIIASSLYSIGSILGPLLVFGGFGLILDRIFGTKPVALLISILVAFIMTNVLLFKKIKKINGMMDVYRDEIKEAPEKPDLPKIN